MFLFKQQAVCLLLLSLTSAAIISRTPQLEDRETACIALGTCPKQHSSSATAKKSTTSTNMVPSATASVQPSATAMSVPIKNGYVAFGDSYAAGMGTGTTETGGCRRAEYAYPRLLAALAEGNIDFQNLPCSGAVVGDMLQGGAGSQIDAWTNPHTADIATVSIGGNDVGFVPILTACVLRWAQPFSGNCDLRIQSAYDKINGRDLINDIASALHQIIAKSGRADFKIYQTGYPAFFNVDTDSCDYSTFFYWQPGHHAFHRSGVNWAYLLKDLRLKLNNLVIAVNTMVKQAVDTVNAAYPEQRVWFIDTNPAFDGRRFCEIDGGIEVIEPDPSRTDPWLFLSSWSDNSLPGTDSALDEENEEISALVAGNLTALPDPNTCKTTDDGDNDWYDNILCYTAKAVLLPPPANFTGPNFALEVVQNDQQALRDGNFSAVEVPWWMATRQAKTFHPRTLGQLAYRNAIMSIW